MRRQRELIEMASWAWNRRRASGAVLVAVALCGLPVLSSRTDAQATSLGVTATNPGTAAGGSFLSSRFTKGYVFTVNTDIFVTHLGFFDEGKNGFGAATPPVGLWRKTGTTTGTLLAQVVVSSTGSLGGFDDTNAAVKGDFRFVPLASPVKLFAGASYVIGANGNVTDRWHKGDFITAPEITVLSNAGLRKDTGNHGLAFPNEADGSPNARANFLFTTALAPTDTPPTSDAGVDFSVDEGQPGVMLDGSGSHDPDGDPLAYAWVQVGGTPVTLSDNTATQPTFDAPTVSAGGETLSFELTVTANGVSTTDTVNVTVVNVNHPPVADAGDDQSVAEGAPVTLHGENSFDIDNDPFTFTWVQVAGSPTVALTGADTANPTFTAPIVAGSGAPGVVATLEFELTVDDGFPADAPASGYTLANVVDRVVVEITNVNNDPTADAGADQTVDENSMVALNGSASSDPDSDGLTYAWVQTGGTPVTLDDATTATPSFAAPFVAAGGGDLTFALTVDDGYGGVATDTVVVHVQNVNDPPLASAARPTIGVLWPPNHGLVAVGIIGVSDPDNNATIVITAVTQDEPTNGLGDGDTPIDAVINADGTVLLRAERAGTGDGRVYHIHFTASDYEGSSSGVVTVSVPHNAKRPAVDGGPLYLSTQ